MAHEQIDINDDQTFLSHVVHDTNANFIAHVIRTRFDTAIKYKAIDFKSNVVKIINECLQHHGIPQFRTKYGGQPFPENSALMICYASSDGRLKGTWFKNIPDDDLKSMEEKADGYTQILRKYTTAIGENNMSGNYGRPYGQVGTNTWIHPARMAALKELKSWIEKAIPDEQDAQRMYEKMTPMAQNAGMEEMANEIDLIRGQEANHERLFRDMLEKVNAKLKFGCL
jgi:hypothetical protein